MTSDLSRFAVPHPDMYPCPGTRIKQWVVDYRREAKWERDTCPRFAVPNHLDNTGADCRNVGPSTSFVGIDHHDCCHECTDQASQVQTDPAVVAWLSERAARPPICADRAQLSDHVQAVTTPVRPNPLLALIRKDR